MGSTSSDEYPSVESFPPTGTPKHTKLGGYDLYRHMGSPKLIVAPMVDQSELAWRILSRRYGSELVYTPMINAKIYTQQNRGAQRVREAYFNQALGEEGATDIQLGDNETKDTDRPLIVQLLQGARSVQAKCDAVDLNLGCPQQIAKRGNFGAFLMDDWDLVFKLINTLHLNLEVPVTAKFRVYDSLEKTLAYARMIERAGAQMVTVHGRTREMKGHKTGLADWEKIRAVKQALNVPVFANGNMLYPQDWRDCLAFTGCDGVMSAEGNLYNPTLFHPGIPRDLSRLSDPSADCAAYAPLRIAKVAHEYLDIVAQLKTPTAPSALKGHMFKITRPALSVHTDLRPVLGKARSYEEETGEARVKEYRDFVNELARRLEEDEKSSTSYDGGAQPRYYVTPQHLSDPDDRASRPAYIPHWYLQPYFRPPLNPPKTKDSAGQRTSHPDGPAPVENGAPATSQPSDTPTPTPAQVAEAGSSLAAAEMARATEKPCDAQHDATKASTARDREGPADAPPLKRQKQ